MAIKNLTESINSSISLLSKYQKGDKKLIKTNRPWLDTPGGVLRQSIILLLGASFSGKTTELENITDDIMNVEINPDANSFVVCTHAFEMSAFSLTLKSIKKVTGLSYKDILSKEFEKENTEKLTKYFSKKRDGRYFINHDTGSAKDIVTQTENFLKEHIDKELVLVELDHTALLKSKSDNKKASIDEMVELFNDLKLKYPNFLLIILTQANRNVLSRIKEKSNEMKLRRDDVYASDTAFHICDYCYGLQNSFYLGVEEYRKIRPNRYPHLSHRFTEEDTKGKVSLYSEGCIFIEVLKDRMADDLDFIDLYTIEIKDFSKEKLEEKKEIFNTMPVFSVPEKEAPIEPISPLEAFGPPVTETDGEGTTTNDIPF